MSLVTMSATYGAGGSEVGPKLAERLGVPFVDRLIPSEVADQGITEQDFRATTEQVILERAENGRGVILGRAAAVVLRDDPRALHVRLDGPREARLEQAMRIQSVDRPAAERRMEETDNARHAYVRHFYRTNARDPAHYHLLIDSTAVTLTACVEIIALAAQSRVPRPMAAAIEA
jgi:cytidylate kinase